MNRRELFAGLFSAPVALALPVAAQASPRITTAERYLLELDYRDFVIPDQPASGPHWPSYSSAERIKELTGIDPVEVLNGAAHDDPRRTKAYWRELIRNIA